MRTLRREDGDLLDAIMAGLSSRSRYLRFHTPIPALTPGMRRSLLDLDGVARLALVAEAGSATPVGVAHLVRDRQRPDEAEIAVAVVDAWQRGGVGTRLVTGLAERARQLGVRRLVARVLPENGAALGLFRTVFPVVLSRRDDDGLVLVAVLGGAGGASDWTITTEDILADLGG
ncbi:MAG TPA: GNAT family N-acetyltransferase [Pseudonocardia sp.]|nr:GNAT family N-acetyltransferase [Pseudonocardia sp.]